MWFCWPVVFAGLGVGLVKFLVGFTQTSLQGKGRLQGRIASITLLFGTYLRGIFLI